MDIGSGHQMVILNSGEEQGHEISILEESLNNVDVAIRKS